MKRGRWAISCSAKSVALAVIASPGELDPSSWWHTFPVTQPHQKSVTLAFLPIQKRKKKIDNNVLLQLFTCRRFTCIYFSFTFFVNLVGFLFFRSNAGGRVEHYSRGILSNSDEFRTINRFSIIVSMHLKQISHASEIH